MWTMLNEITPYPWNPPLQQTPCNLSQTAVKTQPEQPRTCQGNACYHISSNVLERHINPVYLHLVYTTNKQGYTKIVTLPKRKYSALHVRLESKSHEKLFVLVVRDSCHAADALDGKTSLRKSTWLALKLSPRVGPSQNKRIVCPISP